MFHIVSNLCYHIIPKVNVSNEQDVTWINVKNMFIYAMIKVMFSKMWTCTFLDVSKDLMQGKLFC